MSPDQQQNEGQRSHHVRKKLFSDLLEHVRHWRRITSKRGSQASYSNFNFRLEPIVENRLRLYSLGRTSDSSEHTLLYVDIPLENESEAEYETLIWKPLQDSSSAVVRKTKTSFKSLYVILSYSRVRFFEALLRKKKKFYANV